MLGRMTDMRLTYPIGLDIGARHVSAAQLTGKNNHPAVRGLFYRELDGGQEKDEVLVSVLKQIRKSGTFSGRGVVLSVPSKHLSVVPLRIEVDDPSGIEEALVRESEKFLPFPLEEAVIDYPSIVQNEGARGYRALVVAIRRADVLQYLDLVKSAGLRVDAFDFSVSSLVRLHRYLHGGVSQNPVILVHMGHSKSLLVISTPEAIAIQRDIAWGSSVLLDEFQKNVHILSDKEKAKAVLKRWGLAFEDQVTMKPDQREDPDSFAVKRAIYQIITPYIDELLHEMDKAISYARVEEHHPIFEGIYLYGQARIIPSLDTYMESRLNVKVEVVNVLERIGVANKSLLGRVPDGAPLAVAVGLAMRRVPWP